MTKKFACVCIACATLVSGLWAGSYTRSVSANYSNTPQTDYTNNPMTFPTGTVFTATVSGYGPGNGVSFAYEAANGNNYYVKVTPGTGSSQSFYASQTSTPLPWGTQVIVGVSAAANGAGAYCTSTLTANW